MVDIGVSHHSGDTSAWRRSQALKRDISLGPHPPPGQSGASTTLCPPQRPSTVALCRPSAAQLFPIMLSFRLPLPFILCAAPALVAAGPLPPRQPPAPPRTPPPRPLLLPFLPPPAGPRERGPWEPRPHPTPPTAPPDRSSSRSRRLTSLLPVPADTPCLKGRPSVLPFSV
jgi:hypothetical protein